MLALLLVAALAAQDDAAATEAITTFDATISKTKDPSAKVAAIVTLSRTPHERVVSRLGALLTHDDKSVRIAAAQALTTFKDKDELRRPASHALTGALSSGSNQKEVEVLVAIFAAIGHLQEESSGTVLKSHFDDKDAQLAGAAITAAGDLKSKAMVEPLIEEVRDCEKKSQPPQQSGGNARAKPVKSSSKGGGGGGGDPAPDPEAQKQMRAANLLPTALGALSTLTGQNFPNSTEWEKWWAKNRSSFTPTK
ncbi:MAG TPA: HEAT repeat domain-containing protein [Planctomycetota bacterium]|nr:HEAT repeat domain-containing protein [Planctomycetota bacterium]